MQDGLTSHSEPETALKRKITVRSARLGVIGWGT